MVKLIWDLQDLGLPRLFLTSSLCLNWIHELIMNRNVWETCGKTVTTEDLEWAVHDVCLVFPEHADSTNVNIVMTVGVDSFFPHFLLFLFTHNPWRSSRPLTCLCSHLHESLELVHVLLESHTSTWGNKPRSSLFSALFQLHILFQHLLEIWDLQTEFRMLEVQSAATACKQLLCWHGRSSYHVKKS